MNNFLAVKEIWQVDDTTLGITWNDDVECRYTAYQLRSQCPCAGCVDEMTGKRKAQNISQAIRPKEIQSVGRYAMKIVFDDGHSTGIYTYERLREMTVDTKNPQTPKF